MSLAFDTPFGAIPFELFPAESLAEKLEQAIADSLQQVHQIANSAQPANFENTVVALEECGSDVSLLSHLIFNLNHADSNPAIREAAKKAAGLISDYTNDILHNEKLFRRVEAIYQSNPKLDAESQMLLEKTYKNFVRNGAQLNSEQKKRLRQIDSRLSELSVLFDEHVLKDMADFELWVESEERLSGLPPEAVQAAARLAAEKGRPDAWCFSLHAPSYVPAITYADDRALRETLFRAYSRRGLQTNPPLVVEILRLRLERARLLGYENHAAFTLEQRMACSVEEVRNFLDELFRAALPYAQTELSEVSALAGMPLERWDWAYYAEKLKMQKFEIDDQKLKPFLSLEAVLSGIFVVCEKLFGIQFILRRDIPVYHPDVLTYQVEDQDGHLGILYLDLYSRPTKNPGAWKTDFLVQKLNQRPHVSIVCNFTPPTGETPCLLTFSEFTTIFHEFGHALHSLLSQCRYPSLSGTSVYWDFVELPSQLFENWCYESEVLGLFARHYQTGEPIDTAMVAKIKESAHFLQGTQTLRQLGFGYLDMELHTLNELPDDFDFLPIENAITAKTSLLPPVSGGSICTAFSHIFSGAYAAGYYSYKWAEALEADAFSYFEEKGILSREAGMHYRSNILSRGGSQHPMQLFENFRGRKPNPRALIEKHFGKQIQ